jgi:hypothetical protein
VKAAPSLGRARIIHLVLQVLDVPAQRRGLYVTGPFNAGSEAAFRVPDFGVHQVVSTEDYVPHASAVGEVLEVGDDRDDHSFYAGLRIPELITMDLATRAVRCLRLDIPANAYYDNDRSLALGVSAEKIARSITWP